MTKKVIKRKNIVALILFVFFFLIFLISLIRFIRWNIYNKENDKIIKDIDKQIEIKKEDIKEEPKYLIDFKTLKEQNEDTIAYLKVPGTDINSVVVKGENNTFYLNHNFNKEFNYAGWIFADYKNKFDGTDKNIVIYGHNQKNGSMFGTLKNVLKEEWYKNKANQEIILVTENGENIYQVFSVYNIPNEEYYINTEFNSESEYAKFLSIIKDRSIYDFKINLSKNDSILTLSTCKSGGKERIAVHAKKKD